MKPTALLLLLFLSAHSSAQTNVRSLGAAGDGVKDDTAVLQKAISAGVGDLYFPKGTYRLTKTLEFDLTKTGVSSVSGDGTASLLMEGPGPALRFAGSHGGTAAPSTVNSSVWERERTPMVAGVEIVGRHPEADGIEANGTMQLTVSRVVVRRTESICLSTPKWVAARRRAWRGHGLGAEAGGHPCRGLEWRGVAQRMVPWRNSRRHPSWRLARRLLS